MGAKGGSEGVPGLLKRLCTGFHPAARGWTSPCVHKSSPYTSPRSGTRAWCLARGLGPPPSIGGWDPDRYPSSSDPQSPWVPRADDDLGGRSSLRMSKTADPHSKGGGGGRVFRGGEKGCVLSTGIHPAASCWAYPPPPGGVESCRTAQQSEPWYPLHGSHPPCPDPLGFRGPRADDDEVLEDVPRALQ